MISTGTSTLTILSFHCIILVFIPSFNEIEEKPTAKVKAKTVKTRSFKELSICTNFYELLVTGVYVLTESNEVAPFLGSSITNFELESEATKKNFIRVIALPYTNTTRLLQQYFKKPIIQTMGISLFTFICNSLAPIILVDYGNHIFPKEQSKSNFPICL